MNVMMMRPGFRVCLLLCLLAVPVSAATPLVPTRPSTLGQGGGESASDHRADARNLADLQRPVCTSRCRGSRRSAPPITLSVRFRARSTIKHFSSGLFVDGVRGPSLIRPSGSRTNSKHVLEVLDGGYPLKMRVTPGAGTTAADGMRSRARAPSLPGEPCCVMRPRRLTRQTNLW